MFRAEIQWVATLKLEGKLVADRAEEARCLVTKDVLPKLLIVDLTEVSYVESRPHSWGRHKTAYGIGSAVPGCPGNSELQSDRRLKIALYA